MESSDQIKEAIGIQARSQLLLLWGNKFWKRMWHFYRNCFEYRHILRSLLTSIFLLFASNEQSGESVYVWKEI